MRHILIIPLAFLVILFTTAIFADEAENEDDGYNDQLVQPRSVYRNFNIHDHETLDDLFDKSPPKILTADFYLEHARSFIRGALSCKEYRVEENLRPATYPCPLTPHERCYPPYSKIECVVDSPNGNFPNDVVTVYMQHPYSRHSNMTVYVNCMPGSDWDYHNKKARLSIRSDTMYTFDCITGRQLVVGFGCQAIGEYDFQERECISTAGNFVNFVNNEYQAIRSYTMGMYKEPQGSQPNICLTAEN